MFHRFLYNITKFRGSTVVLDRFLKKDEDFVRLERDGITVMAGERVTKKFAARVKELNYRKVHVAGVKMKYAKLVEDVNGTKLYIHIYFDPEKAGRDRKKRGGVEEKLRKKQKGLQRSCSRQRRT
jgi:hypothetical protein